MAALGWGVGLILCEGDNDGEREGCESGDGREGRVMDGLIDECWLVGWVRDMF